MPAFTNQLAEFFFPLKHLGREGPLADARCVSPHDAEYARDVSRREPCADTRTAHGGARRGDEWIRAVIDIEERCLCAFQQNRAARGCCLIQEMRSVGDEWRKTLNEKRRLHDDRV